MRSPQKKQVGEFEVSYLAQRLWNSSGSSFALRHIREIFPWIHDTHPCKCLRRRSNTSRSCSRNRQRQSFFPWLVCKFSPNRQTLSTFHQREVTYVTFSIVTLISWMNVFVVFLSCFMMLARVSPVPHLCYHFRLGEMWSGSLQNSRRPTTVRALPTEHTTTHRFQLERCFDGKSTWWCFGHLCFVESGTTWGFSHLKRWRWWVPLPPSHPSRHLPNSNLAGSIASSPLLSWCLSYPSCNQYMLISSTRRHAEPMYITVNLRLMPHDSYVYNPPILLYNVIACSSRCMFGLRFFHVRKIQNVWNL